MIQSLDFLCGQNPIEEHDLIHGAVESLSAGRIGIPEKQPGFG